MEEGRTGPSLPRSASVLALPTPASFRAQGTRRPDDPCSPGPPLRVTVSSRGRSASLTLSRAAPGPGGPGRTLRLSRLNPRGSPERQLLRAHTNTSSFEFRDLVPGSRYQLEATAPAGRTPASASPCSQVRGLRTGAWSVGRGVACGQRCGLRAGAGSLRAGSVDGAGPAGQGLGACRRGLFAGAWPSRMVALEDW